MRMPRRASQNRSTYLLFLPHWAVWPIYKKCGRFFWLWKWKKIQFNHCLLWASTIRSPLMSLWFIKHKYFCRLTHTYILNWNLSSVNKQTYHQIWVGNRNKTWIADTRIFQKLQEHCILRGCKPKYVGTILQNNVNGWKWLQQVIQYLIETINCSILKCVLGRFQFQQHFRNDRCQ